MTNEHNVQQRARGDRTHPFLDDAKTLVETYRGKANASPGFSNVRLVVIGHTPHPRIAVDDAAMPPFVLLDTGAWIENYGDATNGQTGPSCQIAIVRGHDARIYQFDPL